MTIYDYSMSCMITGSQEYRLVKSSYRGNTQVLQGIYLFFIYSCFDMDSDCERRHPRNSSVSQQDSFMGSGPWYGERERVKGKAMNKTTNQQQQAHKMVHSNEYSRESRENFETRLNIAGEWQQLTLMFVDPENVSFCLQYSYVTTTIATAGSGIC